MAREELDQAVSRLAQYRPFSHAGRDLTAVIQDLVLAASGEADNEGAFESLAECRDALKTLWRLDFEIDELRSAVDALVEQGRARRAGGGFVLNAETVAELQSARAESANVRDVAFGEWEEYVRTRRPGLSDDEFAALTEDLELWLERIITHHGVEAALVLYPENPRAREVFKSIEAIGFDFLPEREERLAGLRPAALSAFVTQSTAAQRTYLADRLNVSYFLTVLTIDSSAGRLVQEKVSGHRAYLDTNVVYAVLGLAKPQKALSALRMLELTRNLGYELAVTPWTVDELRTSLQRARNRVGRVPLPRRELAHLLATASDEKSVVKAFWAAYRDRGTQPQDFFDFYAQFETLLDGHGIQVVDEGITAVDQNRAAIDEQLVLLDRQMGEKWKEDPVMEHDVKHRLLIERLRGSGHLTFSNARYWFLTRDGKLPPYAITTMSDQEVELPFCVATSAWLQIMRSFTPRTDDLDRTMVDLLASPYVTVRRGIPAAVVEEVVGRVDQAKQGDVRLATAVLADTALVADIAQTKDQVERVARVDRAFEVKTSQLSKRLEDVQRRDADSRAAALEARRRADEAAAALELERKQRRILEAELDREKRERAESDREFTARLETEKAAREAAEHRAEERLTEQQQSRETEIATLRGEFDTFKRNLMRGAVGVTVGVVAVAGAVVLIALGVVDEPGLIVLTVTAAALLVLLAIRIMIGAKRGDAIAAWVAIAVGIAGFVWFVVDKAEQSSGSPAPREAPSDTPTP